MQEPFSSVQTISIHAPTRGATSYRRQGRPQGADFNPRSHERSDKTSLEVEEWLKVISIHAPTRGATMLLFGMLILLLFQSTLPREERHFLSMLEQVLNISIHAPTRGATFLYCSTVTELIFQSTLPREERLFSATMFCMMKYFNPRSHERSDAFSFRRCNPHNHFNPRSHERSDRQQQGSKESE